MRFIIAQTHVKHLEINLEMVHDIYGEYYYYSEMFKRI